MVANSVYYLRKSYHLFGFVRARPPVQLPSFFHSPFHAFYLYFNSVFSCVIVSFFIYSKSHSSLVPFSREARATRDSFLFERLIIFVVAIWERVYLLLSGCVCVDLCVVFSSSFVATLLVTPLLRRTRSHLEMLVSHVCSPEIFVRSFSAFDSVIVLSVCTHSLALFTERCILNFGVRTRAHCSCTFCTNITLGSRLNLKRERERGRESVCFGCIFDLVVYMLRRCVFGTILVLGFCKSNHVCMCVCVCLSLSRCGLVHGTRENHLNCANVLSFGTFSVFIQQHNWLLYANCCFFSSLSVENKAIPISCLHVGCLGWLVGFRCDSTIRALHFKMIDTAWGGRRWL